MSHDMTGHDKMYVENLQKTDKIVLSCGSTMQGLTDMAQTDMAAQLSFTYTQYKGATHQTGSPQKLHVTQ
eukprot:12335694-Ditylum_brightwellii.AAC.1